MSVVQLAGEGGNMCEEGVKCQGGRIISTESDKEKSRAASIQQEALDSKP